MELNLNKFIKQYNPQVIYSSFGAYLESYMATYSGGLEMLSGDIFRSAADNNIKLMGMIQASTNGFFRQRIDKDGQQHEEPIHWAPEHTLQRLDETAKINFKQHDLTVGAEVYIVRGQTGFKVPVLLLDTNFEENSPEDKNITGMLYDGDEKNRIAQEYVLGYGGGALLEKLSYDSIKTYHMNEGHPAFLTLQLLSRGMSEEQVRKSCAVTTHTPLDTAHENWDYGKIREIAEDILPNNIEQIAGKEQMGMTELGMYFSGYANAVSEKHARVCDAMDIFKKTNQGKRMNHITNGVHQTTWTFEPMARLYDDNLSDWRLQPQVLEGVMERIPLEEILEAKATGKRHLIGNINYVNPIKYDPDIFTMVWARRFTDYKRPSLLFKNMDLLHQLAEKYPMQVLFAGKAHPNDFEGKRALQDVFNISKGLGNNLKVDVLEGYDTKIAKRLLGGADVWLNTPRRPLEASGTSGMKASFNACVNFSVWDGWIPEGFEIDPKGMFIIGPKNTEQVTVSSDPGHEDYEDAKSLYEGLEHMLQIYYDKPYRQNKEWAELMGHSIRLASYFNTDRVVMKEYVPKVWNLS
ncbi:alpha-glucan family phosphorylase [Candidatus Woesearchaeota archaeon]|nr:alpha-glucan family phosphorylase [Candidatus Woesearchaeota archaeon]